MGGETDIHGNGLSAHYHKQRNHEPENIYHRAAHLTYAEMYEYKDKDYECVVRVPSFFNAQPDSLQEEKDRMRFDYADLNHEEQDL